MAPKKITVVDTNGEESKEKLSNDVEFRAMVIDYSVRFLFDDAQSKIRGFQSLVDGGKYRLGPLQQQQQQQGQYIDNELLRGVKRHLEASQNHFPPATPIETPASLGFSSLQELKENQLIQTFSGAQGQPAILDQTQLAELSTLSSEHQVVAFLTPFFEQTLGPDSDIQVVNSEEYPWLVTSSQLSQFNQKPDNMFCHAAIISKRNAFNTNDEQLLELRDATNKFGVLTNWRLRDCIDATGEAKVKIDNAAFGEVINYARHICYMGGPIRTKLVLYDKSECWLVSVLKGSISHVQTCGWDVPGSRQIVNKFIRLGRSPWIKLLDAACAHWQLTASRDSFLGMGTFGRVFKVSHQKYGGGRTRFMALKLVLPGKQGEGSLELMKEKECLDSTAKALPNTAVHVEQFYDFGDKGAALLLQDVGGEVPKAAWQQVFESLGSLHENNIVHGDPRLSNSIFVQGMVRWIDFRTSAVFLDPSTSGIKQRDITILVRSCCDKDRIPLSVVEQTIQEYDGTRASAASLFEAYREEKTRYQQQGPT